MSSDQPDRRSHTLALTLGALGVVFGDIGTSPIYAFREALGQAAADGAVASEILGVLSLAIWSLILVVGVKYVLFLVRADNNGEGGVLALAALARSAAGARGRAALLLGAAGAALFYGDAIVTPALSVLSAVEGLHTLPTVRIDAGLTRALTLLVLVALFAVQARGTARVSRLFGPVYLLWFLSIAALGLRHIADQPAIFGAFWPTHGIAFLLGHGVAGPFVLGAVFLTVTGAEALTADLGYFGSGPIRLGWFALVFPALALNYLGQGAFALAALERAEAAGAAFQNRQWFFLMAPDPLRPALVALSVLATAIASQAVITGAYSLTQQAVQLGLLPRLKMRRTSGWGTAEPYLPTINWLLLAGVVALVLHFRTSAAMAAAYGVAVSGTMVITTALAWLVTRHRWSWSRTRAGVAIAPFLLLDLVFFGANLLRVVEGGWAPLAVAAAVGLVIATWARGRGIIARAERARAIPLADLAAALEKRPPERVPGVAVFLTGDPTAAPGALLHNLKHNKVLHERNLIVSVRTADRPVVPGGERSQVERIDDSFSSVVLTYGFAEAPDVPRDLGVGQFGERLGLDPMRTSFFIGRDTPTPGARVGMPLWQDHLFLFLRRNATSPTDALGIPPGKVVELGEQVAV